MAKALIIGAGAIGRGFLPWSFKDLEFDVYDLSEDLCAGITNNGGYSSFMSKNGILIEKKFRPNIATSRISDLNLEDYIIAFVAVGPRNCEKLTQEFSSLNCPIFSLENDPETVAVISKIFKSEHVFFGVPDVITSSTASANHLTLDENSLHTEDGLLYLEDNNCISSELKEVLPNVIWASREEMIREWDAKLYLHNTPHCVAAYLGFLAEKKFLHEGFDNPLVVRVVEGVIEELLLSLKRTKNHSHNFLENYADKELKRFSNNLLCDPISRVAREPLRKLARGGRLMGGLTLALVSGVNPTYLNVGVVAALKYEDPRDVDFEAMCQVESLGVTNFLRYFVDIPPSSIESMYISHSYADVSAFIKKGVKA